MKALRIKIVALSVLVWGCTPGTEHPSAQTEDTGAAQSMAEASAAVTTEVAGPEADAASTPISQPAVMVDTQSIEDIFSLAGLNSYVLEIEAALARSQAELGIIPQSAADEISATANLASIPQAEIDAEYQIVRHRMVALLNVWRRRLGPDTANFLHYGATTVDIYDSARVLQLRAATLVLITDLRALETGMIELAQAHRTTPMIGRTLGQHALPITFGKKVSGWIGENRRHIDRLGDLLDRIERSVIMKGAVGSYLGLGADGIEVERGVAMQLGLPAPYRDDWHAARDVFAEYASILAMISRSQGRIGQDVFLLQTTDIAEVVERRPGTAVGSSTMPHKNNPSLSEALIQRSRIIPRLAEIVGDDMINMFERDNTSRPNQVLEEISIASEDMLSESRRLISRLEVDPVRMRENLDRSGGWILAQRFMFALAPAIGRDTAEAHMRDLASAARTSGESLYDVALRDPVITNALTRAEIGELLDPTTYIGLAAEQVDAVIADTLAARENDRSAVDPE